MFMLGCNNQLIQMLRENTDGCCEIPTLKFHDNEYDEFDADDNNGADNAVCRRL